MKKISYLVTLFLLLPLAVNISAKTIKTHAYSLINPPKYGEDFKNFDYVNPDAPKGGTLKMAGFGTYDSFNAFAIKGRSAMGIGYLYDSLMTSSDDEPSVSYCLIAESLEYEEDYSRVIFNIRKEAKFHDGHPLRAEDVVFSFNELIKVNPFYKNYFKLVENVEELSPLRVKFNFKKGQSNKEMPVVVGGLHVLPKHYWETRDISKSSLEIPLGSGTYKLTEFDAGKSVTYERVKDYWAKDLPVNKGQYNFDKIVFEYFKDQTVSFEAFKAGVYDIRGDGPGRRWQEEYKGKNFDKGLIKKIELQHKRPAGMAGIVMNTSKFPLSDINVRKALILAFDYEWINKNFYYGQQIKYTSFFSNSELESSSTPKGKELEILNQVKDLVDPQIFTKAHEFPKSDGTGSNRANLRKAVILLKKAGYNYKNGKMVDKKGNQLKSEIIIASKTLEKELLPYKEKLSKIGIHLDIKFVDSSQYVQKSRERDYGMIYMRYRQSLSPGNEQRNMWHSSAASEKGSKNYAVLKNKAVDRLVDILNNAQDRETLVAATKALDRVLLSLNFIIPDGYTNKYRIALWDKFGRPAKPPAYSLSFSSWWIDVEKEKKIEAKLNPFSKKE